MENRGKTRAEIQRRLVDRENGVVGRRAGRGHPREGDIHAVVLGVDHPRAFPGLGRLCEGFDDVEHLDLAPHVRAGHHEPAVHAAQEVVALDNAEGGGRGGDLERGPKHLLGLGEDVLVCLVVLILLVDPVHEALSNLILQLFRQIHDRLRRRPEVLHAFAGVAPRAAREVEGELLALEVVDVLADERVRRGVPGIGVGECQGIVAEEDGGGGRRHPRDQAGSIDFDSEELGERRLAPGDAGIGLQAVGLQRGCFPLPFAKLLHPRVADILNTGVGQIDLEGSRRVAFVERIGSEAVGTRLLAVLFVLGTGIRIHVLPQLIDDPARVFRVGERLDRPHLVGQP